jgi:crossover junction endodeoxyribonuclease RuvC
VRIFGIDPGSERTGYGCVETDGFRHRLVDCGAIISPASTSFPKRLLTIHLRLAALLERLAPDCVAIENLFFATNVKSALRLGHARGVAMLAAVEAGVPVVEYTPAEIKRAVVGYGRAEKHQVQQMVKLILGLSAVPSPHDVADALAVAICHVHSQRVLRTVGPAGAGASGGPAARRPRAGTQATSWRTYRPAFAAEALRRGKPAAAPQPLRRGKPAPGPDALRRDKPARS